MRYGQRPSRVGRWDIDEFDEAFIVWQGEAQYKVTEDEVREDQARHVSGFILDRDRNYWRRFVVDGKFDRDAVMAKNYRAHQLDFIEAEMIRLGWL